MNIKTLIATLVLGTSSVALADSHVGPEVRDHRDDAAVVIDHRVEAPAPAPAYDRDAWKHRGPSWSTLSTNDQLVNGRTMIRLGGKTLGTLKLQATSGRTTVSQVIVKFANGRSQIVPLNQVIGNGNPSLTIDLNGGLRQVQSIQVTGSSNRRASFEILGA